MSEQDLRELGRRATRAVLAVFFVNGLLSASWFARLPAVRDALDRSPSQMGLLILIGSVGTLLALPVSGAVVQRFGAARTMMTGAAVAGTGFLTVGLGVSTGSATVVAPALFVALLGLATWDVSMNIQAGVVEQAVRRPIMPRFHGAYSLGAVAGAGGGALAAWAGLGVLPHLAVVLAIALTVALISVRAFLPGDRPSRERAGRRQRIAGALAGWRERRTVLIGLLVLAAAITEGAANDWLALAVVDGLGMGDEAGALGYGLFVAAMTVARFAGEWLLGRYGRVAILRFSLGTALAGVLVFALSPWYSLVLAGAVAWGMGVALGFPVGMSAAGDEPLKAATRVSAVFSLAYSAFLLGPPLIGLLAEHLGYQRALLVIAIPLVWGFLLAPAVRPQADATGRNG